jgi:hypothetical protein
MTAMRWHKCDECNGSGCVHEDPHDPGNVHTCVACNGTGKMLRGRTYQEERDKIQNEQRIAELEGGIRSYLTAADTGTVEERFALTRLAELVSKPKEEHKP